MLARHKQLLESYERVREFVRGHMPAQPSAVFVAKAEELEGLVVRLHELLSDQVTGHKESRDDTARMALARQILRERHLKPISKIARAALALDPTALKSLALPDHRLTNTRLLAEAASVREAARKYEQLLIENGRPGDFLSKLDAAIERLREAQVARAGNVGLHVGARAGLSKELQRGRKMMEVLDALVADAYEDNAEVLARWRAAKRVQALPGPRGTGGTAGEDLPTAA